MYQRGYVIDTVMSYPEALKRLSESSVVDVVLLEGGAHRIGASQFCEAVREMRPSAKIVLFAVNESEEALPADLVVDPAIREDDLATEFRTLLSN